MKLDRILIPAIAVAAILLLVVPAVGLVVGMAIASDPADESQAAGAEAAPDAAPPPPAQIPLQLPPLPDKEYQPADSPPQQSTKGARSDWDGSTDQGTVYTYEDGDRTVRIVLQDDLAVQDNLAVKSSDQVLRKGSVESIVRKQADPGEDSLPVFRSESGGELMTLPGGVLLSLDQKWDQATVESFFSANNITSEQISELGFIPNTFLVETEPGFPSLELANDLANQDGVAISSPNWWTEVEAK